MSKVITFSRQFPSYHPRKGEPTYFVEKVLKSLDSIGIHPFEIPCEMSLDQYATCLPKHHTIRAGNRWKVGDWFSPRVWSGKPYNSKQIQFAPDIQVKKVWSFSIALDGLYIDQARYLILTGLIKDVGANDGLDLDDFLDWFQYPKPFEGQIICWNENIEY